MSERPFVLPELELIETIQIPQNELPQGVLHHSEAVYRSVEPATAPSVLAAETPKFSLREWWQAHNITRKLGHTAAALTAVFGTIAAEASPAAADDSHVHHVYDTGGEGLWLHPDAPGVHTGISDLMDENDEFNPDCWQQSDAVNGDNIWLHGTHIATGNTGFAADFYIDTDTRQGYEGEELAAQGIPECGTQNQGDVKSYDESGYDPDAAADYAIHHATDPQTYSLEQCTFFVSEALVAGGLQQDATWNVTAAYGHPHIPGTSIGSGAPGTTVSWNAPDLLSYLEQKYPDSTYTPLDFYPYNHPEVKKGDIIAYDWQGDGKIDHLAIVVGDAKNNPEYPEVSQQGNVKHLGDSSGQVKVGWSYSDFYGGWMQKVYSNPHAYLFHLAVANY